MCMVNLNAIINARSNEQVYIGTALMEHRYDKNYVSPFDLTLNLLAIQSKSDSKSENVFLFEEDYSFAIVYSYENNDRLETLVEFNVTKDEIKNRTYANSVNDKVFFETAYTVSFKEEEIPLNATHIDIALLVRKQTESQWSLQTVKRVFLKM